jgi:hypothetical protein
MNWPQYVILCTMVVGLCLAVAKEILDKERSSVHATVGIFIHVLAQVGVAGVLHAGGFW